MPASGKPLHIRLFLEGIEAPCISCIVQVGMNAPSSASIQVVPIPEVLDLKPRTMVHVFFHDPQASDSTSVSTSYKLLFAGEMVGRSFVKVQGNRSVVLQCLDFSSYWDTCYSITIDYGPQGNVLWDHSSLVAGSTALFSTLPTFSPSEQLVRWLGSKPQTEGLTTVSGLAGGVIRMLEAVGGISGHTKGVNDFFTVAQLRCRLLEQITAEQNDNTARNILASEVFYDWLKNALQGLGQNVTFRDLLLLLFRYVYYDFVPNPVAKYDPASVGANAKYTPLNAVPQAAAVSSQLAYLVGSLADASSYAPDPGQAAATTILNTLQAQQSTLSALGLSARAVQNYIDLAAAYVQPVVTGSKSAATLLQAISPISGALALLETSTTPVLTKPDPKSSLDRLHTQILRPDCYFAAPPACNVIFPDHYTTMQVDRPMLGEVTRVYTRTGYKVIGASELIGRGVLAPDINDYAKAVLKAPNVEAARILMPHEYYTGIVLRREWMPDTFAAGSSTNAQASTKVDGKRLEWLERAALFHFFKYRLGPRTCNVAGRFNPFLVCGFPSAVVDQPYYVPANLQQTLAGTSLAVALTQNAAIYGAPRHYVGMLMGFTHSIAQDGGSTSASLSHVRQHSGADDEFLELLVTQTTTQQSPVTIGMNLDNVLASGDEALLKLMISLTPPQPQTSGTAQTTGQRTNQAVTVPVQSVADGFVSSLDTQVNVPGFASSNGSGGASGYTKLETIKGLSQSVLVPVPGALLKAGMTDPYYGGNIVGVEIPPDAYVGIPAGQSQPCFSKIILHETVTVPVTQSPPIEEILRPSWFSKAYSNNNIGGSIYEPFFGCGSIIDVVEPQTSTTVAGAPSFAASSTTQQALLQSVSASAGAVKATIEEALNLIAYQYGLAVAGASDVDAFVYGATSRPVANLLQVLGGAVAAADQSTPATIGFHEAAVDPINSAAGNLQGLLVDTTTQLPRINMTGKKAAIPPQYDVRPQRRAAVLAYLQALQAGGRGFVG
jgi:hypothetical protein